MRNTTIKIKKAKNIFDFLFLRKLRNDNRYYMTRKHTKIGLFQQLWFYLKARSNFDLFIIYLSNKKAGYLLINKVKNLYFITEVVDEKYRKLGLGTKLILFAQDKYPSLTAEIFSKNLASIKLHSSNNFKRIKSKNEIEIYRWKR